MERSSALCLAGLLACTAHLAASLDTSPALQRPVHLSVVVLIICGAALVLLEKIRPLRSRSAGKEQQYAPIPLSDLAEGNSSRPTSPVQADTPVPEYRPKLGLKLHCALVVFLTCCRIEILRQVINAIECASSSMETAVPVLITLADWWLVQRKRQPPREEDDDDMDSTVYGDLLGRVAASNWRPLVTAVLLSWSSSAVLTVYDAKERHDAWLKWASNSSSVEIAAADYTARYKRHPPPHFDEWYAYAVEHSSRIINDFDSIHEDLLPYWSLSPAEIRQRTWDAIADPSKGIGGILIRDGKAHIAPNVPRNQRLMLDGIIKMIDQFGQWLPDMDLAFNLNNECRVAIPYEEMESARSDAVGALANEKPPSELTNAFSDGRADGWHQLPGDEHNSEHFVTLSSRSIWDEFGSITCPPDSPARTQSLWNRRDYCASCALPHSLGAFFANSTLAADICHQPDLANLHGFYTSPNVFIGTNSLIPIFSQSKAPGFNDILYPSAWNYMDRVSYAPNDEHRDPPFDDKKPTIFWRGATTEGFAAPDSTAWHGMTRQRMVHALSITSAPQTLPLPHPVAAYKRKLRYAAVPAPALRASIPLDVAVSDVVRCAEPACAAERALLAPSAEKIDFQAHWLHRYLLDADGSGFSGRFLAFLRSRCLPVKVAPLFREWWHGRVTPWLHYVPVDPRLQGLWATLAYLSGFKGIVEGKEVEWEGRGGKVGRRLAEEGRAWAGEVLRGVDMEVYFFRLLLEWGRLTDDARDGIGYAPAGGGVGEEGA
ncbi:Lipopolysaccharide-modifying protein [Botryosphaeria dothidea]|uniref:Lipopolysaccharide-modifying protein n=1 Tax=Botryosphaeria dothidea TaxID=55169 RepID=A0A8H4J3M3_9PEZI|nr:Lipopolysaccharide-modifying protein [Botryosphaeria dothidea]